MRHLSIRCGSFRCEQVAQKLSQFAIVRHVATENEPAILVDDVQSVGPRSVSPMNSAVEVIDNDWKTDVLEALQIARVKYLLLQGCVRRVVFRRMGFTCVEED